jgi:TPR repeat protein
MLLAGIVILIIASVIQCWYAANKAAYPGDRAAGYFWLGTFSLVISILLLITGVATVWISSSILIAIVAIAIYFFLLPLLVMPLMQRIYIPALPKKVSDSEWEKIAGLQDAPAKSPSANKFWTQLFLTIQYAAERGDAFIDINAGELHRKVGSYPDSKNHRMPVCCKVMKEEMQPGDVILHEPQKGSRASLTIRYILPRQSSQNDPKDQKLDSMRQEAEQFFRDRDSIGELLANSGPVDREEQATLASYYRFGIGTIPKDDAKALYWYRKAAEQGHPDAQIQLLESYFYGDEIPQDYVEAAFWAHKASEQGNAYGQLWLGGFYEKGEVLQQDYSKAAYWYRKAAEVGFPNAKWFLGMLYKSGLGVPQDNSEAYFWQTLAVSEWTSTHVFIEDSYSLATKETGSALTEAQRVAVRQRVDIWIADHPAEN